MTWRTSVGYSKWNFKIMLSNFWRKEGWCALVTIKAVMHAKQTTLYWWSPTQQVHLFVFCVAAWAEYNWQAVASVLPRQWSGGMMNQYFYFCLRRITMQTAAILHAFCFWNKKNWGDLSLLCICHLAVYELRHNWISLTEVDCEFLLTVRWHILLGYVLALSTGIWYWSNVR